MDALGLKPAEKDCHDDSLNCIQKELSADPMGGNVRQQDHNGDDAESSSDPLMGSKNVIGKATICLSEVCTQETSFSASSSDIPAKSIFLPRSHLVTHGWCDTVEDRRGEPFVFAYADDVVTCSDTSFVATSNAQNKQLGLHSRVLPLPASPSPRLTRSLSPSSASSSTSSSSSLSSASSVSVMMDSCSYSSSTLRKKQQPRHICSLRALRQKRIEQERIKQARRIAQGNSIYHGALMFRENLAQERVRQSIENEHKLLGTQVLSTRSITRTTSSIAARTASLRRRCKGILIGLQFEMYHSIPGLVIIVLYCLAHLTTMHLVDAILNFFYAQTMWPGVLSALILFISVLILRITGLLWSWVSDEKYKGSCFMMRTKVAFGDYDTTLMKWIRRHGPLRFILETTGGFFAFWGLGYFSHYVAFAHVCDKGSSVYENMPSRAYEEIAKTKVQYMISGTTESAKGGYRMMPFERVDSGVSPFEKLMLNEVGRSQCQGTLNLDRRLSIEEEDEDYVYERMNEDHFYQLFGSGETQMHSLTCHLTFNTVGALVSVSLLELLDVGFWDF